MLYTLDPYLDYITRSMKYPKYDVANFYNVNYLKPLTEEEISKALDKLKKISGDKTNKMTTAFSPIKKNMAPVTLSIEDQGDTVIYHILTPLVNITTAYVSIYANGSYGKCLKLEYETKEFNGLTYVQTATYAICIKDNQELDEENMELNYDYELGDLVSIKIPLKDKTVKKYFVPK